MPAASSRHLVTIDKPTASFPVICGGCAVVVVVYLNCTLDATLLSMALSFSDQKPLLLRYRSSSP